MERLRRLDEFWSWLPAFRAVAETEHLPSAAEQLHASPPALSRTVHKLEERIGHSLFRRTGRRIERTDAGDILLRAVREAMRIVHEALVELEAGELEGPFAIASTGYVTWVWLLPALEGLLEAHPRLRPELRTAEPTRIAEQLLQGRIDLALLGQPLRHPILETVHLTQVESGIYCGEGHPLFGRDEVALDELLEHAFVAPPPGPDGQSTEGWPARLPRRIAIVADSMQVGLEACARGQVLAVLPDVACRHAHAGRLHRVPFDLEHRADIFAVHRPVLREGGAVDLVLDAIRAVIRA